MKALRVHVERIVRPIHASYLRKDRMREELLAHLCQMYEEERARRNDDEAAATAAIQRFGATADLTREMQASVPRIERVAFWSFPRQPYLRRRDGESALHYLNRVNTVAVTIAASGMALLMLVATILVAASDRPRRPDQPSQWQLWGFVLGCMAIMALTMYGIGCLVEFMRQEMERRDSASTLVDRRRATWRLLGYAIAHAVFLGGAIAGGMALLEICIRIPLMSRTNFWVATLSVGAFAFPFGLLNAWSWRAASRRIRDWYSLDLDEESHAT